MHDFTFTRLRYEGRDPAGITTQGWPDRRISGAISGITRGVLPATASFA